MRKEKRKKEKEKKRKPGWRDYGETTVFEGAGGGGGEVSSNVRSFKKNGVTWKGGRTGIDSLIDCYCGKVKSRAE